MSRPRIAPTALIALGLFSGAALAEAPDAAGADGQRCFNGYAYTLQGDEYRYTEHHEQQLRDGKIQSWDVTYVGRDGHTIATKQLEFGASDTVPTYTLEIAADGYREGIRREGERWLMFRRKNAEAEEQTKAFDIETPMAADSGFDMLVRNNFDRLTAGETVPFNFAAAGRQAVVKLRARQTGTTTFEGQDAVVFDAELDMFLVNFFVDSLQLTYDPDSHRLLEYRGIGNMHDASGKVYPVRVSYASEMPAVAEQAGAPAAACGSAGG
jgi:hypothetical protein